MMKHDRLVFYEVLQLPGSLSTSIAVKASGSGGTLIYTVDNKGRFSWPFLVLGGHLWWLFLEDTR